MQQQMSRPAVDSAASLVIMGAKPKKPQGYAAEVAKRARPLSPGSNCALPAADSKPGHRVLLSCRRLRLDCPP